MKLYNINELKDSRIFFDKKPPIFLSIFISLLLVILVLAFFFSKTFVKPYIVKAQGIATTSDNQLISSQINGEVISIHIAEGQKVSKNEPLFTISNGQEGLQNSALTEQVKNLKTKLEVMKRYEESLNTKANLMQNSGIEQEYYGKVEYYLLQSRTEDYEKDSLGSQLKDKKQKKVDLEKELTTLTNELQAIPKQSTKGNSTVNNSTEKDQSEESNIDENNLKRTEIQGKIDAKKSEIDGMKDEISQIEKQQKNPSSQSKEIYTQLTSDLGSERFEVESKIKELEGQMSVNSGQESSLIVKARNDGIVHYLMPFKVGMSIQANQVVAEVSQNKDDQLQIEAYILARDISKVKIGQKVQIAIEGVNSQKYGTLKGKLLKIDSGTITQETSEGNQIYYKCLVRVSNQNLKASDGSTVKLIKSMPVEARVIYEQETYYEWILKMLNFKN